MMEMTAKKEQFGNEQIEMLQQPLKEESISFRKGGGGRTLKYLKIDRAMDAANRIFGFGQWGYKLVARGERIIDDPKKGKMHVYTADIELYVNGAMFPFPGDGFAIVQPPFTVESHETAYKDAESDAVKRALRHYGDQFGLSLYDPDDMVEAEDGTMKPVASVQEEPKKSAPARIVDAARPALSPAKPQIAGPSPVAQEVVEASPVLDLPPEREIWDAARGLNLKNQDRSPATIEQIAAAALSIPEEEAKTRVHQGLKYKDLKAVYVWVQAKEEARKNKPRPMQKAS